MNYSFTLDFINKPWNGLRIKEFVPGEKLVLSRRVRFPGQGVGLKLFCLLLMGISLPMLKSFIEHPEEMGGLMVAVGMFYLLTHFFVIDEWLQLAFFKLTIEPGKNIRVREWRIFRIHTKVYPEEFLVLRGNQKAIYAQHDWRKVGKKSTGKTLFLDIVIKKGSQNLRSISIQRKKEEQVKKDVEALNDLFDSFIDYYQENIPSMELPEMESTTQEGTE